MGRLYQRGERGTWWGDYVHPATGKRYQRSTKTRDKKVAAERLRQWELETVPQARGRRQRLSEAIDAVIASLHNKAPGTIEMYEQKRNALVKAMGDVYINTITLDTGETYIKRRTDDGAKPHTIAKELIVLRRALKYAHKRNVIPDVPPLPEYSPQYKPRETWLTEEQFSKLLGELEPHRRLWVGLATLAGGSAGEVERCTWEHTKLIEGVLRMPGTKRETRDRWIPISPMLYALLDETPPKERKGLLVTRWHSVRRDLHAACDRAGIPRVSPNDLRRTFASWLVQSGVDLYRVSKLMGHSSTRMVEKVYGKLAKQNLIDAVGMVPAFQRSPVTPLSQNRAVSDSLPVTPALLLDSESES